MVQDASHQAFALHEPAGRVLVIEADQPLMRFMVWFLRGAGFEVRVMTGLAEIETHVRQFDPQVVLFNDRLTPGERQRCIEVLRLALPSARLIDASEEKERAGRRLIDVSDRDEGDPTRDLRNDRIFDGDSVIALASAR